MTSEERWKSWVGFAPTESRQSLADALDDALYWAFVDPNHPLSPVGVFVLTRLGILDPDLLPEDPEVPVPA